MTYEAISQHKIDLMPDPSLIYQQRLDVIKVRYSRLGSDEESKAAKRPLWLARMAHVFALVEFNGADKPANLEGLSDPIDHFRSKLKVLTRFPTVASTEDVDKLDSVLMSVAHFRPGNGYSDRTDAGIFVKDLVELISEGGADINSVASYFKIVGGLVTTNPALLPAVFSGGEIQPLAGTEFRMEVESVMEDRGMVEDLDDFEVAQVYGEVQRRLKLRGNDGKTSLTNLKSFFNQVVKELRVYDGGGLDVITEEAIKLCDYFSVLEDQKISFEVSRPAFVESIYVPTVVALGEYLTEKGRRDEDTMSIAGSLIATIKRGRLAVTRDDLLSFFASFRDKESVKEDLLPKKSMRHIGAALNVLEELSLGSDTLPTHELKEVISGRVIPDLILQTRIEGQHMFEWSLNDYLALGLGNLWDYHNSVLEGLPDKNNNTWDMVSNNSVLLDFTGQVQPVTGVHLELIREVEKLTTQDLIKSGILKTGQTPSGIYLGVSVNSGNPLKEDWTGRKKMLRASLRGMEKTFVWSDDSEVQGPTITKLSSHLKFLRDNEKKPLVHGRFGGTEKLDHTFKRYTSETERLGVDELNKMPHIFALQKEELTNSAVLVQILKTIYRNFPNAIIFLTSVPEVHSSYFRSSVNKLSDKMMSTLVHPSIIPRLKSITASNDKTTSV